MSSRQGSRQSTTGRTWWRTGEVFKEKLGVGFEKWLGDGLKEDHREGLGKDLGIDFSKDFVKDLGKNMKKELEKDLGTDVVKD